MSKVISSVLQVGTLAVTFIPGFNALHWAIRAGITIGLGVGAALTAPRPRQQQRQASVMALTFGDPPRQVVFGTTQACRGVYSL